MIIAFPIAYASDLSYGLIISYDFLSFCIEDGNMSVTTKNDKVFNDLELIIGSNFNFFTPKISLNIINSHDVSSIFTAIKKGL